MLNLVPRFALVIRSEHAAGRKMHGHAFSAVVPCTLWRFGDQHLAFHSSDTFLLLVMCPGFNVDNTTVRLVS
jgi:hypothetical protein